MALSFEGGQARLKFFLFSGHARREYQQILRRCSSRWLRLGQGTAALDRLVERLLFGRVRKYVSVSCSACQCERHTSGKGRRLKVGSDASVRCQKADSERSYGKRMARDLRHRQSPAGQCSTMKAKTAVLLAGVLRDTVRAHG
jgi:hypothetical protein